MDLILNGISALHIFCYKSHQRVVLKFRGHLNGIATDFTILYIGLFWDGRIHQHRDLFPAEGTLKKVFEHFFWNKNKGNG